jgi:phenylalanyl-tRNA synthetase beta chain
MNFLSDWLKKILAIKKSSKEIAEKPANNPGNVVVGQILEIKKHPNADRLQITSTDVGGKILQIVCGAPNIKVGQKVPVALVGAILPGNFEIKEAEIRGVKSFGMLCAEDELGLGSGHSGIMILNEDAEIGTGIIKNI